MGGILKSPAIENFEIQMNSLQLNAKMLVRGIYTSDNIYNPKTLPKELQFRINKNDIWENIYNFYMIDTFINIDNRYIHSKIETSLPEKVNETKTTITHTAVTASNTHTAKSGFLKETKISNDTSKSVFVKSTTTQSNKENDQLPITEGTINNTQGATQLKSSKQIKSSLKSSLAQPKAKPSFKTESSQFISEEQNEFEKLEELAEDSTHQFTTTSTGTKIMKVKKSNFTLEPNPILVLSHFQGYQARPNNLISLEDDKIVYSCGNTIALMDLKTKYQRFFIGQAKPIQCLTVNLKQNILVSAEEGDENCKIYLWSIYPQKLETNFNTGLGKIVAMDICTKFENHRRMIYLVIAAKDNLNRNVVCIYDLTDFSYKQPYLFAKQISDWDIQKIRFLQKRDNTHIIACGKESIRFWRLKHKILVGNSLVLNEHGRGTVFTDFVSFDYLGFSETNDEPEVGEKNEEPDTKSERGKL